VSGDEDEDDKPTVVLDLNALKKQKLKQEEDLANIAQELEFAVGPDDSTGPSPVNDSETFAEEFLEQRASATFPIILFDFQSDFFQKTKGQFPKGHQYHIAKTLPELNKFLGVKTFQIVVFNYEVNPKAVNQLSAQIKLKFPTTKTMIMAKAISPEKAKMHAKTASGASGYYQFPLNAEKIQNEFLKIHDSVKKVS
jgi:hypothetical protein